MHLSYLHGLHNHLSTETIAGALPQGQNAPQQVGLKLYAEQLSLSAFTMARKHNFHSWLYRHLPSVALHAPQTPCDYPYFLSSTLPQKAVAPEPLRWSPYPFASAPTDWLHGLHTYVTAGDANMHVGGAVHLYACNRNMAQTAFYNADGDLMILPETGTLLIETELGRMTVAPGSIAVVPRGIIMSVQLLDDEARGYVVENYGQAWQLPELGVIGANGLANVRDFEIPVAWTDARPDAFTIVTKSQGHFWQKTMPSTPFNVVAWHGTAYPYRYDLAHFNTLGSISYDHPDPSIFTVLTSPSTHAGVANLDFVIFPPRWLVAEHTFRPPYFHRNVMSEFMGLIQGRYDAKEEGFMPGGASLHNGFTAHGPDFAAFQKASTQSLKPEFLTNTLAFMVEGSLLWHPSPMALSSPQLQHDYLSCWDGFV